MKTELERVLPQEIEARSFEIITEELGNRKLEEAYAPIIKRVIHTTADFDYADNLVFSPNVLEAVREAFQKKACIVTDTQMARAGINKRALQQLGMESYNFISDEDVAEQAKALEKQSRIIEVQEEELRGSGSFNRLFMKISSLRWEMRLRL